MTCTSSSRTERLSERPADGGPTSSCRFRLAPPWRQLRANGFAPLVKLLESSKTGKRYTVSEMSLHRSQTREPMVRSLLDVVKCGNLTNSGGHHDERRRHSTKCRSRAPLGAERARCERDRSGREG